jgi:effector-binding domain-containing protein
MAYAITVQQRQAQPAAVVRFECGFGQAGRFIGPAYGEIGGYLHELGLDHEDTQVFAQFLNFDPKTEVEAGFTVGEPVPPKGRVVMGEMPGGEVAFTTHVGPYATLPAAGNALRAWMAANGREPAGGLVEVYVDDPQTVPEAELRTEVFYPLK